MNASNQVKLDIERFALAPLVTEMPIGNTSCWQLLLFLLFHCVTFCIKPATHSFSKQVSQNAVFSAEMYHVNPMPVITTNLNSS